jgi:hypothetical protein
VHDYHEGQPNYSANQVLHDGCEECFKRGQSLEMFLGHADKYTFERAWARGADMYSGEVSDISNAELPILRQLGMLQEYAKNMHLNLGDL